MHRARTGPAAALALLALLWIVSGRPWPAAAQEGHPEHGVPAPPAREIELTAAPHRWEIQPGLVVDGWAYNGRVPGPELRVREGDPVRIVLRNRLPAPTTIHWHGIDVPLEMDGVPGVSQEPVPPGGDFTYEFVATNPGTRMYHSHVDTNGQLEVGLYGALLVEPREPEPVAYDREFTYILDEKALDFTPDVALGRAEVRNREGGNGRGGAFDFDLFLINGKAGDAIPPLRIAPGERIRLRLINLGSLPHSMHLHGHSFTLVASDGNPVPAAARLLKDTVLLGPGERYDLEIAGTNPGVWMFHCHMPNHGENGMMTALVYDGFELPSDHAGRHPATPPSQQSEPPAASLASAKPQGDEVGVRVIDNRFEPGAVTVPIGTVVLWQNTGSNLHTATSFDGIWDTGALRTGERGAVTFERAGEYRYFCRQHLLGGMLGRVVVRQEGLPVSPGRPAPETEPED
jgi:FtsP/CotA-like multicopper oxidase with cupredoxin domain/plastocyanin